MSETQQPRALPARGIERRAVPTAQQAVPVTPGRRPASQIRTRGRVVEPASSIHDAAMVTSGVDPTWLTVAIEHAADAILITDLEGTIRYVNVAFERTTGRRRADVLGQHTRILGGGEQPDGYDREIAATIRRGEVWSGDLPHRGADGSLLCSEATIAPVRDAAGSIVGAVAVRRDVTRERALQTRLEDQRQGRVALAAALEAMRAGETAEATAEAIVVAVLGLPGLVGAGVWSFEPSGAVVPLANVHRDAGALPVLGPLSAERAAYLRERASHGPWIEAWRDRPEHPYNALVVHHAIRLLAYAPIRSGGGVVGFLVIAGDGTELGLAERLPIFVECASFAGALLGPHLRTRTVQALSEARIGAIIADGAFHPVFQPIVELATTAIVGYEALTRFLDGTPPERVFAEAAACDLSVDLEAATLAAILAASGPLPASAWLNLNVSPELVLAGEPLRSMLGGYRRQTVLELTEHIEIADYGALREAIRLLGPNVRLAVDDAGAGFSSLRHILELRPDYVKLDRGIVHGIGRDPARQALVAGMAHFALKTGTILIAEGVETAAEARQLQGLGVSLAQGHHLGRPTLAARLVRPIGAVTLPGPARSPGRRARTADPVAPDANVGRAVNIGETLAAGLREIGIASADELRTRGAVPTWERLRESRPRLATAATLLLLVGAVRGIRVTQLPQEERADLRLFAKLGRQAS